MFGARITGGENEMVTQSIVWQSRAETGNSGGCGGELCGGDLGREETEEEASHNHHHCRH